MLKYLNKAILGQYEWEGKKLKEGYGGAACLFLLSALIFIFGILYRAAIFQDAIFNSIFSIYTSYQNIFTIPNSSANDYITFISVIISCIYNILGVDQIAAFIYIISLIALLLGVFTLLKNKYLKRKQTE